MKEYETIKVYGKKLNVWNRMVTRTSPAGKTYEEEQTTQIELAYNEYDSNGNLIRKGSEDFSIQRCDTLRRYRIFTWDGQKYNKGGNRWFEEALTVRVNRNNRKDLADIARKWFPEAAAISIR